LETHYITTTSTLKNEIANDDRRNFIGSDYTFAHHKHKGEIKDISMAARQAIIINEASKIPLLDASEISEKPGQGLSRIIDGHTIHVTHRKKLDQVQMLYGFSCCRTHHSTMANISHDKWIISHTQSNKKAIYCFHVGNGHQLETLGCVRETSRYSRMSYLLVFTFFIYKKLRAM